MRRLAGIADFVLTHDRPIHVGCDDSLTRLSAGGELLLRRSRGRVPRPVRLPRTCPVPTLAVDGESKATIGLGQGRHAILSHHLGDLGHDPAYPYRPSSVKNRQRWTVGALYPESFCRARNGSDARTAQTECLVEGDATSSPTARGDVRRTAGRNTSTGSGPRPACSTTRGIGK
jgi:hypothetical protein